MRRNGRTIAVALAVALVAAAGAGAAPALTVKGDAKAWSEVEAAYVKFGKLKTYRARTVAQGAGTTTIEAVHPDRFRSIVDMGSGNVFETITVGNESRFRQGTGAWMCSSERFSVPTSDPKKMYGEVTVARGPAATVGGVQTQTYTITHNTLERSPVTSTPMVFHSRLYVAVGNGLPKRSELLNDKGAVEASTDFYDYNAPITINLPACK